LLLCTTDAVLLPPPAAIWLAQMIWWKSCFTVAVAADRSAESAGLTRISVLLVAPPVSFDSMRCTTSCSRGRSACDRRATALF
jgi:hypothetical protein